MPLNKMHIKINIPPERAKGDRWNGFPTLHPPNKQYVVALNKIMLKEHKTKYTDSDYNNEERRYIDIEKEIQQYWLKAEGLFEKWQEIHQEEYARISMALEKLNLLEAKEHNVEARAMGAPEKVIDIGKMNSMFRLEVDLDV